MAVCRLAKCRQPRWSLVVRSIFFLSIGYVFVSYEPNKDVVYLVDDGILPYEIPMNYKGPIVEGWPPTKNRSMPLYVKPYVRFQERV